MMIFKFTYTFFVSPQSIYDEDPHRFLTKKQRRKAKLFKSKQQRWEEAKALLLHHSLLFYQVLTLVLLSFFFFLVAKRLCYSTNGAAKGEEGILLCLWFECDGTLLINMVFMVKYQIDPSQSNRLEIFISPDN